LQEKDDDQYGSGRVPTAQLDPFSNNVLFIWTSAYEASRFTDIQTGCICFCMLEKIGFAGGFKWRRLMIDEAPFDTLDIQNLEALKCGEKQYEKIVELSLVDGSINKIFTSLVDAVRKTGLSKTLIVEICRGWTRHDRYFLREFEYKRRVSSNEPLVQRVNESLDFDSLEIVTMDYNWKILHVSKNAKEAISKLASGSYPSQILQVAIGVCSTHKGYRFAFKFDLDLPNGDFIGDILIPQPHAAPRFPTAAQTPRSLHLVQSPISQPSQQFTRDVLEKMTLVQLKDLLRNASLKIRGNKLEVIDRLLENQSLTKDKAEFVNRLLENQASRKITLKIMNP